MNRLLNLSLIMFLVYNCTTTERKSLSIVYTLEYKYIHTQKLYGDLGNKYEEHSIYIKNHNKLKDKASDYYTRLLQLCYCHLDSLNGMKTRGGEERLVKRILFFDSTRGFPVYKTAEIKWHVTPFLIVYLNPENQFSYPTSFDFIEGNEMFSIDMEEALNSFQKEKCNQKYHGSGRTLFFREIKY